MSDTLVDVCRRCFSLHTTESCVRASSSTVILDPSDVFMWSLIDSRIIRRLPTEIWQLLLSYLPVKDILPDLPLTNKYLCNEVVWGKWSGPLMWGEMARKGQGIDALEFRRWPSGRASLLSRMCCTNATLRQLEIVLASGIHLDIRCSDWWTPIHFCCFFQHVHKLKMLLESGADPNVKNNMEYTPLMTAIAVQSSECVSELLRYEKVDVNATDSYGLSALMLVYDFETAALLIRHGANRNHECNSGLSVRQYWISRCRSETLIHLLDEVEP
jgi:Ankyrin repeats (many copies)